MKIVKFRYNNEIYWGKLSDTDKLIFTDIERIKSINSFEQVIELFDKDELFLKKELKLENVELLAPVLPTKNILCIGKNYYDHILEFDGNDDDVERVKEIPIFFSKALSSVTGPFHNIYRHENVCDNVDYEAELAIIIGNRGTNIDRENALSYVYGYTIVNDVTSRDLQDKHQQWFKGKSLDSHCPIGPWIVTKDEIEDGNNLSIRTMVNDEVRQDANTNLMIHDIPALIAGISKGMTLNPGDVIATGTPSGVGKGYNPPKYLQQGDKIEISIEGIGSLINYVVFSK